MTKTKKSVLIWSILVVVTAVAMLFTSCQSKVDEDWMVTQIQSQSQQIQELQGKVNSQQATIDYHQALITNLQSSMDQNFNFIIGQMKTFQDSMTQSINNINTQLTVITAAVNK